MYRTDFWTLWKKARVGCFKRTASSLWQFWRVRVKSSIECSSIWVYLLFMVRLGLWICEKVKYHFHHIISKYMLLTWLINDVYLDHLLKMSDLSTIKLLFLPPSILCSLEGNHPTPSTFTEWGVNVSLHCKMGGGEYLHYFSSKSRLSFFPYLFSPIYLFNKLFILL